MDCVADIPSKEPTIVSISDVHGYRSRFISALTLLSDHPNFRPLVEATDDGLKWVGGEEYVLVVNGDVVDRGPDSAACLELLWDLYNQAPENHFQFLVGNHEYYLLYPAPAEWDRWYSSEVTDTERSRFYERVLSGVVSVSYGGYEYTYSHAGAPDGLDIHGINANFRNAAETAFDAIGWEDEKAAFERAFSEHCPSIYRNSDSPVREDPDAGVIWLDFSYLRPDSPQQVVGHTPHESIKRNGNVVCSDVIIENLKTPGGEAVLLETPDGLTALVRESDGGVTARSI